MLKTEMRNPLTTHIDRMETGDMLRAIQNENENAVRAVGDVLPDIERAVDAVAARMKTGGRLFYVGCGTSGRLGVLDASECPPTYGVSPDTVVGIIAGGDSALRRASEGAEDDPEAPARDLAPYALNGKDSLVGISAAGGAKYVLAAMDIAKKAGALVIGISNNEGSAVSLACDIAITPDTGAEAVAGSTRMKAGTAQKMILNMLSTGVMIRMGYVRENMMINVRPTNDKLRRRCIRILRELTDCGEAEAAAALMEAKGSIEGALALLEA